MNIILRCTSFVALVLFFSFGYGFAQTASISGTVTIPAVKKASPGFRGAYSNRLSAPNSGSKKSGFDDVIISAHPISFKADAKPLAKGNVIGQRDAAFVPRVLPVTRGTTVLFVNNDPFYHNVFSLTPGNTFNIGRRTTGEKVGQKIGEKKIEGLGEVKIFCDIHTQMNAVILSLDTPYFTRADADGSFEITDLPDGRYEIRVYHPDFTASSTKLDLKSGEKLQKDFSLSN
jgi:plastocyanin